MKEATTKTALLSCCDATVLLEKRITEEALTEQQKQRLRRHLNECEECRRLVNLMSALPDYADELSDAEVRSAYRTAMENRSRVFRDERRKKIAIVLVAAAAAVTALLIDWGTIQSRLTNEKIPTFTKIECPIAPTTKPAPGVVMTYCTDRPPEVNTEHDGELRVYLSNGAVGLRVDPNRPGKAKVSVETPHGEVRVKGTIFTVRVDEENTWVEVFRGKVAFIHAGTKSEGLSVEAGKGADLRQGVSQLTEPKTEAFRRVLDTARPLSLATRSSAPSPTPITQASGLTPAPAETTYPRGSSEVAQRSESSRSADSMKKGVRNKKAVTQRSTELSVDDLIREAQSCLISHDWTCASSRYQHILKRYLDRPESTAVMVSLAKIELRHLNRPKKALEHFQAYRKRAPRGPMAEEALFGMAETYRRLRNSGKEEMTLRLFLEQYPESFQCRRVHERLKVLKND